MRQLVYALRFSGRAAPAGPDGSVLAVTATAPGATFVTAVGSAGLISSLELAPGAEAAFASELTVTGETSFQEVGTIAFGNGHWLRFATVGSGYLNSGPGGRHGAAVWRVEGGDGAFTGAQGLIAVHILLADDLTVTSYHLGVVIPR